MRVAILSDIHGNDIALDAVLAEARSLGVEQYWLIGDFSALGPQPTAVLERVANLPGAQFTRGNTDRYIVTGEGPPPHLAAVRENPALIPTFAAIAASLAWTRGFVTAHGWFEWLERLALDIRLTTPSGFRLLAVHAAPGTDDGEGVHAGRSNTELSALVAGADADIIFVVHTHEFLVRRVDDVLIANLGSISTPRSPDLRASFVLLDITGSAVEFAHRRVSYDHQAFIESVHRSRHPATEFILSFQNGERPGRAAHSDHTSFVPEETISLKASSKPGVGK